MGATLNLHRAKTVTFFYTFSSPRDTPGQDLSNKKNQSSLPCLYPEICCGKNTFFFFKRVILLAPTVDWKIRPLELGIPVSVDVLWGEKYKKGEEKRDERGKIMEN